MSRQISVDKVVAATLCGIKSAQVAYEEMSGGDWLWNAPEYFITTKIAEEIQGVEGSKFVDLEYGAKTAIENAGARGRGSLHKDMRPDGKIDIVLWWGKGDPRAIIEVKNQIYYSGQFDKDIKRIKQVLKRKKNNSSFDFGLFAFYDSADDGPNVSAKKKITNKVDKILSRSKKLLGEEFDIKVKKEIFVEGESAWGGICFMVKNK